MLTLLDMRIISVWPAVCWTDVRRGREFLRLIEGGLRAMAVVVI